MEPHAIQYRFEMEDGTRAVFDIKLDPQTMQLPEPGPRVPEWAALDFHQCPHCPLSPQEHRYCPAAAHLGRLVTLVDHLPSHAPARVEVSTAERNIVQQTTVQRGVSALMGLLMATSGCPVTRFFRPMARFHLPLASAEETAFRAASTYLLAQYFKRQRGEGGELELDGLRAIYADIHQLNRAFAKRLRAATQTDSSVNAVILLDVLAGGLAAEDDDRLPELEAYFSAYLEGGADRAR